MKTKFTLSILFLCVALFSFGKNQSLASVFEGKIGKIGEGKIMILAQSVSDYGESFGGLLPSSIGEANIDDKNYLVQGSSDKDGVASLSLYENGTEVYAIEATTSDLFNGSLIGKVSKDGKSMGKVNLKKQANSNSKYNKTYAGTKNGVEYKASFCEFNGVDYVSFIPNKITDDFSGIGEKVAVSTESSLSINLMSCDYNFSFTGSKLSFSCTTQSESCSSGLTKLGTLTLN